MQRVDALSARLQHPGERLRFQNDRLAALHQRLSRCISARLDGRQMKLQSLLHRSLAQLPQPGELWSKLSSLNRHLRMVFKAQQGVRSAQVSSLQASIEHLAPTRILSRGYSLVRNERGLLVTRSNQVASGESLDITLAEGGIVVQVHRTRT